MITGDDVGGNDNSFSSCPSTFSSTNDDDGGCGRARATNQCSAIANNSGTGVNRLTTTGTVDDMSATGWPNDTCTRVGLRRCQQPTFNNMIAIPVFCTPVSIDIAAMLPGG